MSDDEHLAAITGAIQGIEDTLTEQLLGISDALSLLALSKMSWALPARAPTTLPVRAAGLLVERISRRVLFEEGIDPDDLPDATLAAPAPALPH